MNPLHPQFIKDSKGKNTFVIITIEEFDALVEELEEIEDVRAYDEAKAEDDGEHIPMEEAFRMIEESRKVTR